MNKKIVLIFSLLVFGYMVFAANDFTSFQTNTLIFGKPSASDKNLTFKIGTSATNPGIKWNNTATQLQFSNDGTTFVPFGTSTDASKDAQNIGFATSVSGNSLTIALKTKAGADPSSSDIVYVGFRNSTAATGTYSTVQVTSALSMVVSVGSTLGTSNGSAETLFVYLINNSGAAELAVSRKLYDDGTRQSTTAEGGAGGADSATAIYSTTARSNVPLRLIGRIGITEATAGTWATNATELSVAPFFEYNYPIKYQVKTLSADESSSGTIGDLTFNNLRLGRFYRVYLQFRYSSSSQSNCTVSILHNGSTLAAFSANSGVGAGGASQLSSGSIEAYFVATASTVTFSKSNNAGSVTGNGTNSETWARIEEIPVNLYETTTDFL